MSINNLTPLNGFDEKDLNNAMQNNYAWSIGELNDYIYVGTGKNILSWVLSGLKDKIPNFKIPLSIATNKFNSTAEIWRYKKDGTRKWEKVYKAEEGIEGFRYIISTELSNFKKALLVAGSSNSKKSSIKILMTYNGVVWKEVQGREMKGYTSRAMEFHHGKIYVATVDEQGFKAYLYSSVNPEIYPWKTEIDSDIRGFNEEKNPTGSIYNIKSFNDHLYVSTTNKNGIQLWRTEGAEPEINKWLLIGDNGFGDKSNNWSLSMSVFKDYLYISTTKQLPESYLIPRGAELIRIDKSDNWEVIVGGEPEEPVECSTGIRKKAKSGYEGGFSNSLNIYIWQVCEYKGALYATTLDHGSNIQTVLELFLLNKEALEKVIPAMKIEGASVAGIIDYCQKTLKELKESNYQFGFDIFMSTDGIRFTPVNLNGLGNRDNYGGRMLFVSSENKLYIGTANPYEGCEVWESDNSLRLLKI